MKTFLVNHVIYASYKVVHLLLFRFLQYVLRQASAQDHAYYMYFRRTSPETEVAKPSAKCEILNITGCINADLIIYLFEPTNALVILSLVIRQM